MAEVSDLVCQLYDIGAVKFGQFKLKSGLDSPVYFDLRVMISRPKLMSAVSDQLWSKVAENLSELSCVCGVPYTALPLATLISVSQDVPMLIRRKEPKNYGTKRSIEGSVVQGAKCLIVEDVISTGSSVLETARALRAEGVVVEEVVVLVDREQGGEKSLRESGITVYSVLTLTELLKTLQAAGKVTMATVEAVKVYLAESGSVTKKISSMRLLSYAQRASSCPHPLSRRLLSLMDEKKTNLSLSADVKTAQELIDLADKVGPHICLLKTHADMMADFTTDTAESIKQLAAKHNFLIMEDRKFADIGNTVRLQFFSPSLHLSAGWAHLVTCHALPGPGVLDALRGVIGPDMGCVVVVEMSSQGALTTAEYTRAGMEMVSSNADLVAGIVARHLPPLAPSHLLLMVPGVRLSEGLDSLGQQYLTPDKAVLERGSDIIIVGRGIHRAEDVVSAAAEYRVRGYAAYLQRCQQNGSS